MSTFTFSNFFQTTLSAAVASGDTTINVASATNAPTITTGQQWAIIVQSASTPSSREVMYVTAISSDAFTVTRGQEGTAAGTWAIGDYVIGGNTEGVMAALGQLAATQTWSGQNTFDGTGSGNAVTVSDTSNTGGVNIKLVGNGSSTPSKFIRVLSGVLQFVNSAYTTAIALLDDSGNLTLAGKATLGTAPPGNDNSLNVATTSFLYSCMGYVAAAAGFQVSLGSNGYIFLPSWLGSWGVQWGDYLATNLSTTVTFPIAFPSGSPPFAAWAGEANVTVHTPLKGCACATG